MPTNGNMAIRSRRSLQSRQPFDNHHRPSWLYTNVSNILGSTNPRIQTTGTARKYDEANQAPVSDAFQPLLNKNRLCTQFTNLPTTETPMPPAPKNKCPETQPTNKKRNHPPTFPPPLTASKTPPPPPDSPHQTPPPPPAPPPTPPAPTTHSHTHTTLAPPSPPPHTSAPSPAAPTS